MDESKKKSNGEFPTEEPSAASPLEETATASGEEEVESLRRQLEAKEVEAKENYDRYLRQLAEAENFKKRMAREKTDSVRFANESIMRDLLPWLDNLGRAIEHAKGGDNGQPLVEGIEMVLKGLLEVLNRHGLSRISALGEPFDPQKHEALAQAERSDCEPNTVIEEHQKGYFLHDRLLRPALVTVAKSPESKEKKSSNGEVEKEPGDD